jgi:hypothetical protein
MAATSSSSSIPDATTSLAPGGLHSSRGWRIGTRPTGRGGVGVLDGGQQRPQAGDVHVVAAGVHDPPALGRPLDPGRLGDGQGVQFGAQPDRRARRAESAEGAGLRDRKPVDPGRGRGDGIAGVRLVAPQVRVGMDRAAQGRRFR